MESSGKKDELVERMLQNSDWFGDEDVEHWEVEHWNRYPGLNRTFRLSGTDEILMLQWKFSRPNDPPYKRSVQFKAYHVSTPRRFTIAIGKKGDPCRMSVTIPTQPSDACKNEKFIEDKDWAKGAVVSQLAVKAYSKHVDGKDVVPFEVRVSP